MALEAHITELGHKHKALDLKIEEETSRPTTDTAKVTELKRQKLLLKDEINRLKTTVN